MKFNVSTTPSFKKDLKRLAKKYNSLKFEFLTLIEILEKNPLYGTFIGNSCYKIRLSIASKGKGKSGGARIITYVQVTNKSVLLISIFDKSEQETLSPKQLADILKDIE
jgi:mRNA-degrading endonuclease RelE of RelBE toxin-antitoxin system